MFSFRTNKPTFATASSTELSLPERPNNRTSEVVEGVLRPLGELAEFIRKLNPLQAFIECWPQDSHHEIDNKISPSASGVEIEPRRNGETRRPGMSYELYPQPTYPGRDEYFMEIRYNGARVGHANIACSDLGGSVKGYLNYLQIDSPYMGQGLSIDAIDMVNEIFRNKWKVPGFLKNEVGKENPEWSEAERSEKRNIYQRMGWIAVQGSSFMELPLQ